MICSQYKDVELNTPVEDSKQGRSILASGMLKKLGPGVQRALGNLGWLLLDRVLRMGFGLVVGVWVARYFGPDQFGSLNFAIAFVGLFGVAATLGLDAIVVAEVLDRPNDTHAILGTSVAMRLIGGCVVAAVSIGAIYVMQPRDHQAQILVTILSLTLLAQAFDTIDAFFQSKVRSRLTVWSKNGAFLILAIVRVILIRKQAPLWAFAAAYSAELLLGGAALIVAYRITEGHLFSWTIRRDQAVRLLRQSWPVMLSGMAITIYLRLDTVMLKVMQGDYAVGVYSAATRVSEVWYFVPTTIVSTVSPAILRVKENDALFNERMRKLFSLMALSGITVGAVVALLSPALIHALYSESYEGAAPVLAIHVWASVFVFLGVAQAPWNLARDQMKPALYRTLYGAALNALLNLWLIPHYGAAGAAVATVFSYAVANVFANALNRHTRPIFFMQMRAFLPQRFW